MSETNALILSPMQVCLARGEHLHGLVDCHIAALPDVEITRLGRKFLSIHHRFYLTHPEGICLVSIDEMTGRVAGFIVGGRPEMRKEFLRKNVLRLMGTVLCKICTDPRVRLRVMIPVKRAAKKIAIALHLIPIAKIEPSPPRDPAGTWSYILFLGTHPDFRRRGVMRALIEAFRIECSKRGFQAMHLSTRRENNASTALYLHCGWEIILQTDSMTYFRQSTQ